jgi:Ni,Fe-hydrogenase maturation factor
MESVNLSTHSLSFSMLAKLLPDIEIYVLGVQPESLEFGENMSEKVKQSAEKIAVTINTL